MNRRADPCISNPGIERKPQTDLRHQLLNIEISILSKQLFPELWTFGEKELKAQKQTGISACVESASVSQTIHEDLSEVGYNSNLLSSPFRFKGQVIHTKLHKKAARGNGQSKKQLVSRVCFLDIKVVRLLLTSIPVSCALAATAGSVWKKNSWWYWKSLTTGETTTR